MKSYDSARPFQNRAPDPALTVARLLFLNVASPLLILYMDDLRLGGRNALSPLGLSIAALLAAVSLAAGFAVLRRRSPLGIAAGRAVAAAYAALFIVSPSGDLVARLLGAALNLQGFVALSGEPRRYGMRDPGGPAAFFLNAAYVALATAIAGFQALKPGLASGLMLALLVPTLLLSLRHELRHHRTPAGDGPLLEWFLLPVMAGLLYAYGLSALLLAAGFRQAAVLIRMIRRSDLGHELAAFLYERPTHLFVIGFVAVILTGALLLTFPVATTRAGGIRFIDALFTSTSATCVTGLVVLDTPVDFTLFGQLVILLLIQVGGLGIMTISTFVALLAGRALGLREESTLEKINDVDRPKTLYNLVHFIVVSTLVIEATGAALLFYLTLGRDGTAWNAWRSVFHSVSAFCNAGFALHSDNLLPYRSQFPVLLVIASLIALGGIGFSVLATLRDGLRTRRLRLSLHSKIALYGTAFLIVGGTLLYAAFEWNASLAGLSVADKFGNAFFQSVTTRTAGFNSVTYDRITDPAIVLMILLMFIGACPGGTGGGIKVSTAAVLFLTIATLVNNRDEVEAGGRHIPRETILKAVAVTAVALALCVACATALLFTQTDRFQNVFFETVSAFGTVGLSLGTTAKLDTIGKAIVIFLMFAGRVGPLSLVLLIGTPERRKYSFPVENVLVG